MLSGDLLKKRLEFIQTKPLNEVMDVLFVFFENKLDVVGVPDGLGGLTNNPRELANILLNFPEKAVPGLSYEGPDVSKKRNREELRSIVFCRTNPNQGNDLHLTVKFSATDTTSPFEIALLSKDGTYTLLSEEVRISLLGK